MPESTFIVRISSWNFVRVPLGTCKKFQLEILIRCTIYAIHKFWENILESLQNISETTPCLHPPVPVVPRIISLMQNVACLRCNAPCWYKSRKWSTRRSRSPARSKVMEWEFWERCTQIKKYLSEWYSETILEKPGKSNYKTHNKIWWLCLVPNSTTRFAKFWRPSLDSRPRLFLKPQYVWFLTHL